MKLLRDLSKELLTCQGILVLSERRELIGFTAQHHILEVLSLNKAYFSVSQLLHVNFTVGYEDTEK